MAAREEPGPARRADDRRRKSDPKHSIAETDPLRWARDDDVTTVDLPAIGPDPDDATTTSLPAVSASTGPDIVDHRQPPERSELPQTPSARTRRAYTGRHRQLVVPEPTRLGLSTAGMTIAIGVLGAALTIMHTDSGESVAQQPVSPTTATSPTTTDPASAGAKPQPQRSGTPRTAAAAAATAAVAPTPLRQPAGVPAAEPAVTSTTSGIDQPAESTAPRSQPRSQPTARSSGQPRTTSPNSLAKPTKSGCQTTASGATPEGAVASTPAAGIADAAVPQAAATPDAVASASPTC